MMLIQKMDNSLELCNQIKEQIESDCCVRSNELGGETLLAYESIRKVHKNAIKEIYKKMLLLRKDISRI